MSRLRTLLREPLVHFALGGMVLFGAYALVGPDVPDAVDTVRVPAEVTGMLALRLTLNRGEPPTPEQLRAAIDAFVEEEILFRHAVALGLDADDPIVRRRLVQKARLLIEDSHLIPPPDEARLRAYYHANEARYHEPARVDFSHVYLPAAELNGDRAPCAAVAAQLRAGAASQGLGRPFALGLHQRVRTKAEVARVFGADFARTVLSAAAGEWIGPLDSRYGCHAVRVTAREAQRQLPFAEARPQVEADWLAAEVEASNRRAVAGVRSRYRVEVDGHVANTAVGAAAGATELR